MSSQLVETSKLAIALNTAFKQAGLNWQITEGLPKIVESPSIDNFKIEDSKSAITYESFEGSVHLYVLKDNQGNPLKRFEYLNEKGESRTLDVDGVTKTINVLDFRNQGKDLIQSWKIKFSSPGLNLEQSNLVNAVLKKEADTFVLNPVLANNKIPAGGTLERQIVFSCDLVNGKAPVAYNFELSTASGFTETGKNTPAIARPASKFDLKKALDLTLYGMTWQSQGKHPSWNKNPHRDDCFLDDGQVDAKRDLSGGFGDAGDAIKPNFAAAINASMFAWCGLFYPTAFDDASKTLLADIIKHYNDYFIKCHEIDTSRNTVRYWHWVSGNDLDHKIGQHYESQGSEYKKRGEYRKSFKIDAQEPGTEPCAATAASLAFASLLLKDQSSLSERYLTHAKALYAFAEKYKAKYVHRYVYKSESGYWDELCLGAIALYAATKNESYLTKAEAYYKDKIGFPGWTWMVDNSTSICTSLLAYYTNKQVYKDNLNRWGDSWLKGINGVNAHRNSPLRNNSDWGTIPQSATAFAQLIFACDRIGGCHNPEWINHASKITNYVLGDNPRGFSWLIGFGDNFPRSPHHRNVYASGDINKPAQRVGLGLWVAGEKASGEYNDSYMDWITNECGCYNPGIAMLIAALGAK